MSLYKIAYQFDFNSCFYSSISDEHVDLIEKRYKSWMKEMETFVGDLKKRIGKPRNQMLAMELEGSFKSLSID